MDKISIKILYLSFHNSIKKKYGINRIISKEDIFTKLGRQYLVPKKLRIVALKELEEMNLIKKEDNNSYRILDIDFDMEENINKFYSKLKLF
jgi:hypothetical protein